MLKTLDLRMSRHLVSRTGLGADWNAIQRFIGKTPQQAVQILLRANSFGTPSAGHFTPWNVHQNLMESANPDHKMRMHRIKTRENERLKQWWVGQMLRTQSPLVEKMTLFWHSHFTSSLDKVEQPSLLYRQNQLLRKHSLGNFAAMLKAVAKDPAMSVYLDGHLNERRHPNENFARELLELFTLGYGNYTDHDVREVARAFTGWSVDRRREAYRFNQDDHDTGPKTVLGKKLYTGDQVLNLLLQKRHTALNIVNKLWHVFVSDLPADQRYTQSWAQKFQDSGYDIKILLREILTSRPFWDQRYQATLTKSPADLVIGTLRTLPFKRKSRKELVNIFRLLGQDVFDPPNVSGWAGGQNWINSQTLLVRSEFLSDLSGSNLNAKVNKGREYRDLPAEQYQHWLLAQPPVTRMPGIEGKPRLVRKIVLDPMYQLI